LELEGGLELREAPLGLLAAAGLLFEPARLFFEATCL
jgi:hypothetical protein